MLLTPECINCSSTHSTYKKLIKNKTFCNIVKRGKRVAVGSKFYMKQLKLALT